MREKRNEKGIMMRRRKIAEMIGVFRLQFYEDCLAKIQIIIIAVFKFGFKNGQNLFRLNY
jgi:hypothetical protein